MDQRSVIPRLDERDSLKKVFFSEEKKQKTFTSLPRFYPEA
jgi:hypothetical protein